MSTPKAIASRMTTRAAHPTRYALDTPSRGTSGAERAAAMSIGTRASWG